MLKRRFRLKRSGLLTKCFKAGRRLGRQNKYIDIVALPKVKEPSLPRFCFVVSKKVSNKAVHRNRVRRRLSEAIRQELLTQEALSKKLYAYSAIIVIAKPEALNASYKDLKAQLAMCFV